MTLQDIKKENGLTNVALARLLHCSPSKAGMILQGRYIHVMTDNDIDALARALSNYHTVTFERCWLAMVESYNAWAGTPGQHQTRHDEVKEGVYKAFGIIEPARRLAMVDSSLESRVMEVSSTKCLFSQQ